MTPTLFPEVVSEDPDKSQPAYLRVDFTRRRNGGAEIPLDQIIIFMQMTALYARHENILRVLAVVEMPRARNHYALYEIDTHAKHAAEIFRGLKLAYVNQKAKVDRMVYISGVMSQLEIVDCQAFTDERKALHWLLYE